MTYNKPFTCERDTRDKEEPWPKRYRKRPQKEYQQIKGGRKEMRITHDNFGGAFDSVGINRLPGGPGLSHEQEERRKKKNEEEEE